MDEVGTEEIEITVPPQISKLSAFITTALVLFYHFWPHFEFFFSAHRVVWVFLPHPRHTGEVSRSWCSVQEELRLTRTAKPEM